MGYIYKITNLINNKIYIGQTRFLPEERFKQHLYEVKKGELQFPLYKAIRKYKEINFTFEIIEEVEDSLLNEREIYWINQYDSYISHHKGYNCTYGGEGNSTIDKLEVYKLWDQGLSVQQIATMLSHDRSAIRKILQTYEKYSIQESNLRGDIVQAQNRFQTVNQYDLQGNLINSFYNMKEAERQTGISSKSIWCAVHLQQKTCGGYQWRFKDDLEHPITDISNQKTRKYKQKVQQIDMNNNQIIQIYKSAAEAARQTQINANQIRRVCQNKGVSAGGYKWQYC